MNICKMSSDNIQMNDSNQTISKSKISEAQKKAQKKYVETHLEQVRANKRNYYYRQKDIKLKAIREAETLRNQLETLKSQISLLQN
jgi:hypothetical protein